MSRTVLLPAAMAASLLVSCGPTAEPGVVYASGSTPYGCASLSEFRQVETRISEFRERRDKDLIDYDEVRTMIVDSYVVQDVHFVGGTCVRHTRGRSAERMAR